MTIRCAAVMCHAPIVIPAIAGSRQAQCKRTTEAMRETARRIVAHAPQVLALISPHAPRDRRAWGIGCDEHLRGTFARFGFSEIGLRCDGAPGPASALLSTARSEGLETWAAPGQELDHGSLVPLHFLREAGFTGQTLIVALPDHAAGSGPAMGRALSAAAASSQQPWAVLASGDMSHRLQPGAPAGYDPEARRFDARFVELIASGNLRAASDVDAALRERAAEDVVDSVAVASAAVDYDATGHEVLSYEGPFGVGYLEAILCARGRDAERAEPSGADADAPPPELLSLARQGIDAHLRGRSFAAPSLPAPWDAPRGVFVTLRDAQGRLRGCIGHVEPACDTLVQEVVSCAISAATRDGRFAGVGLDELPELRLELSVLSPAEPTDVGGLDPARYGLIVLGRGRRGVLLPGIEGVGAVSQQIAIAARKAGLRQDQVQRLQRFQVRKLAE